MAKRKSPAPENRMVTSEETEQRADPPAQVRIRVGKQPIFEQGTALKPGTEVWLPEDRVVALGGLVERI